MGGNPANFQSAVVTYATPHRNPTPTTQTQTQIDTDTDTGPGPDADADTDTDRHTHTQTQTERQTDRQSDKPSRALEVWGAHWGSPVRGLAARKDCVQTCL